MVMRKHYVCKCCGQPIINKSKNSIYCKNCGEYITKIRTKLINKHNYDCNKKIKRLKNNNI